MEACFERKTSKTFHEKTQNCNDNEFILEPLNVQSIDTDEQKQMYKWCMCKMIIMLYLPWELSLSIINSMSLQILNNSYR